MQLPPLDSIRVIDLTQFLSGPHCTQILADLGAEVIKIESPEGDLSRHIPPHFIGADSLYYMSVNRGKQSVCINLKSDEGRKIARDLISTADVVVDNFRPGVLTRLGLDHVELRAENPRLVWCSISGFGQDGPYRDKPAYDMIVQALSGGMSMTGEPGRASVRAGIPIGDLSAGMYAAIAISSALYRRGESGRGDYIDVSMLDCQVAMLSYQAAYYLFSGKVPGHQGSAHDSIPTYRSFRAAGGGELVVTANTDRMWQGLCRVLGREDLLADPRFASNLERFENRDVLLPELEAAFLSRRVEEWLPLLEAESIPTGVVNTLDQVMADPQVLHRELIVEMEGSHGASVRTIGNPLRFSDSAAPAAGYPPALGEDTRRILGGVLGLSDTDVDRLAAQGAVVAGAGGVAGR